MEVGDLVRLSRVSNAKIGLAIELYGPDNRDWPWIKVFVLFPNGYIGWEYDIDLEVVNENR